LRIIFDFTVKVATNKLWHNKAGSTYSMPGLKDSAAPTYAAWFIDKVYFEVAFPFKCNETYFCLLNGGSTFKCWSQKE